MLQGKTNTKNFKARQNVRSTIERKMLRRRRKGIQMEKLEEPVEEVRPDQGPERWVRQTSSMGEKERGVSLVAAYLIHWDSG